MAKTDNTLLLRARGTVAGDVVFKRYYDTTVISKKPDMSKRVLSEKQKEWQDRMALATAHAKEVCSNEERKIKEMIRLKVPPHKSVFRALIKEHLEMFRNMPVVKAGWETGKLK
jgi:hypothetical protein